MYCPKCNATLEQSGDLEVDGEHYEVYQCDTCVVSWNCNGEVFDVALSFAVDASGRMFHPETLEPLTLN